MGNFLEAAVAAEALAEKEELEGERSKSEETETEREDDTKTPISVRDYIAKNKNEVEKQSGLKNMLARLQTTDMIENTPNDSKVISMRKCIEKLIESPVIMDHLTAPQEPKKEPPTAMHHGNQFRARAATHGAECMPYSRKGGSPREAQLPFAAQRPSEATGRENQSDARQVARRLSDTDQPRQEGIAFGHAGKNDPLRGLQKVVESKSAYIPNMKKIAAAGDPVWQVRYKEDPAKPGPDPQMMRYHQSMKAEPQEGGMHHPPIEHPGPYPSPRNEQQASRYPPLEGLRPAPPGPSIVHGTGFTHVPDRKSWAEAQSQGPRGRERDPRWPQNIERQHMTSKIMPDNPRPRMVPDDPRARMAPDDLRGRLGQEDPRARMGQEDPRGRMGPDDPRVRMMAEDPRSKMFMNDQRSKFMYEDPRARMMSEEQRQRSLNEEKAMQMRLEKSPKIFSSTAIDLAYKRGLLEQNQRRQSFTDMNIVSPRNQTEVEDNYLSRPRSKTLDQKYIRQPHYINQHQRINAMKPNENLTMLSPGKRQEMGLEPSDTVGAHLMRLAQENPMIKYERPPSSATSGTDVYQTSSQPRFTRALPPMAIRKSEDKAGMLPENLQTHRVDYIRARGGIGDEQIVGFGANSQITYSKEGSRPKMIEENFRMKPSAEDKRPAVQDEVRLRKAALAAGPVGALIYAELMAQKGGENKPPAEKLSPGISEHAGPYRKEQSHEAMKMGQYYQYPRDMHGYNPGTKPQPYHPGGNESMGGRDTNFESREQADHKKTLHYYPPEVELKKGALPPQYGQEIRAEDREETQTQALRKRPGGECPLDLSVKKQKGNDDQDVREAAFRREYQKFLKQQQEQSKKAFKPRDLYAARHSDNDSQDMNYEESYTAPQQFESRIPVMRENLAGSGIVTNQDLESLIPANDVLFIECKLCGSTYGSLPNFRRHFSKSHTGQLSMNHIIVHTISAAKNARAKQLETSGDHESSNMEGLTCSQCGNQSPVEGDYRQKVWLCRECYEQFSDRDSLERHLSVAHGLESRFRCSNCQRVEEPSSICQATPDSTIPNEDSQHADKLDVSCQANISASKTDDDPENYSQEHTRFLKFKYPIKKMVSERMKKSESAPEEVVINPRKRPLEWCEDNQKSLQPKGEDSETEAKRIAAENMQQHEHSMEKYSDFQTQQFQGIRNKIQTADDILQDVVTKSVVSYQSSDESSKDSIRESPNEKKVKSLPSENPYAQNEYPSHLQHQQSSAQSVRNDYSPNLSQHRETFTQRQQDQGPPQPPWESYDNKFRTKFYRRPMYSGQCVKDAIASLVDSEFGQDNQRQSDMNRYNAKNEDMEEKTEQVKFNLRDLHRPEEEKFNQGKEKKKEVEEPPMQAKKREEGQGSTVGCIVARLIESSIMKPSSDSSARKKKLDQSFHDFLSNDSNSPQGRPQDGDTKENQCRVECPKDNSHNSTEENLGKESKPFTTSSHTEHRLQLSSSLTAQGTARSGMKLPSTVYGGEMRPGTSQQAHIYNMEQAPGMRLQTIPCGMEQNQGSGPRDLSNKSEQKQVLCPTDLSTKTEEEKELGSGGIACNTEQNQRTSPQSAEGTGLTKNQNVTADISQQMTESKSGTSPQNLQNIEQKSNVDHAENKSEMAISPPHCEEEKEKEIKKENDKQNSLVSTLQGYDTVKEQFDGRDLVHRNPEQLTQKDKLEQSDSLKNESTTKCSENKEMDKEDPKCSDLKSEANDPKEENKGLQDVDVETEMKEDLNMEKENQTLTTEREKELQGKIDEQSTENSIKEKEEIMEEGKISPQEGNDKEENKEEGDDLTVTAELSKNDSTWDERKQEADINNKSDITSQQNEGTPLPCKSKQETDCQDKSEEEIEKEAQVTESSNNGALEQSKSYQEDFDDGMESDTSGELVIDLEYNESEASDKVKGQREDNNERDLSSEKTCDGSLENNQNESGKAHVPEKETLDAEKKTETQIKSENSETIIGDSCSIRSGGEVMAETTSENTENKTLHDIQQRENTVSDEKDDKTESNTTDHSFQEKELLPSSTDGATDPKESSGSSLNEMRQCSVVLMDASSNPNFQRFIDKK